MPTSLVRGPMGSCVRDLQHQRVPSDTAVELGAASRGFGNILVEAATFVE